MMFKNRRAVGGLISLIGIIVVFSFTSVAYLELNSSQTKLINTSILTTQRISDQNNEYLDFSSIIANVTNYEIEIENTGSKTVEINSFLIDRNKFLVGKGEIDSKIIPGGSENISINLNTGTVVPNDDKLIFTTSLGKQCIIPADVGSRIC